MLLNALNEFLRFHEIKHDGQISIRVSFKQMHVRHVRVLCVDMCKNFAISYES